MADHKPHPANVPGDFYVKDGCCTMCEVPFAEAPELFGTCDDPGGYFHCFVKRQPETPDELNKMLSAIRCAEFMCIRYRGTDRQIQLEILEGDSNVVCDHLAPDLQERADRQEADGIRRWKEWQATEKSLSESTKPWWKFWGK